MKYYSVFSFRGQPSLQFDSNDRYSSWFTVHNPYVDENVFVYDMELNRQDSVSGTFTFKVPLTHPNINAFDCGLIVEIREFDGEPESIEDANVGGNPIWIGRLINLSADIYGNLNCTCEGPLGFLKDGFICATNAPLMTPNTSLLDYIKVIISNFLNAYQGENTTYVAHARQPGTKVLRVETSIAKTAQTTYVDHHISQLDGFETVNGVSYYAGSDPINVFDFVKKYFEDGLSSIAGIQYASEYAWLNMEIVPRSDDILDMSKPKTEGLVLWLGIDDVSQGFGSSRQRIIFGENLIDAEVEYDFNNIATSLMVLGAEYEGANGQTVRYNLNGAIDNDTMHEITGYYIDSNNGAIEKYGVIQKTVVNDHLDSQGNVALWANMHRNALSNPVVSFKCRAIDISTFDPNQSEFTLGTYAEVGFPGLDGRDVMFYYRCTGIKQNLSDPSKDEYTFSYSRETTLTSNSIFKNVSTTAGSSSAAGSDGSGSGESKYELPIASSEILGGIKVGHNLAIENDGTLRMTYVDEGKRPETIRGYASTIEGYNNIVSSEYSHGEGTLNELYTSVSHIEGYHNISNGLYNVHMEGYNIALNAIDSAGIEIPKKNSINSYGTHIEGYGHNLYISDHIAGAHIEGYNANYGNFSNGDYLYGTHIEGYKPILGAVNRGEGLHVEGYETQVWHLSDVRGGHLEGYQTELATVTYDCPGGHVEGYKNRLRSGYGSHVEGGNNFSDGSYCHVGGSNCKNDAIGSFIHGEGLKCHSSVGSNDYKTIFGFYNTTSGLASIFSIGNGASDEERSNAFSVTKSGGVYGSGAYNSSGADYAELFEWWDSNPNNEDRVGRFVTLDGEYISLATFETSIDDILGIISGNPSVAGDVYDDQWSGMYLTDVYGRPIYEEVHHDAELDDEGNTIREAYDSMERKVNPEYDHTKFYKPRSQRSEWDYVGLMGKLVMLDDGTAEVNGYVKPSEGGIATRSETRTKFRVMRRLDENHIKILVL